MVQLRDSAKLILLKVRVLGKVTEPILVMMILLSGNANSKNLDMKMRSDLGISEGVD